MVSECFRQYCLTVRNPQIMQASEGLGFRYYTYSVMFEHRSSAYQEKVLTTVYWVVIYPLHNILPAISPVGANVFCKNKENSSSQTGKRKNLVLQLTDVIVKVGRWFHIPATVGRGIVT